MTTRRWWKIMLPHAITCLTLFCTFHLNTCSSLPQSSFKANALNDFTADVKMWRFWGALPVYCVCLLDLVCSPSFIITKLNRWEMSMRKRRTLNRCLDNASKKNPSTECFLICKWNHFWKLRACNSQINPRKALKWRTEWMHFLFKCVVQTPS